MNYILKANPTQIARDGLVEVSLPAFYGANAISVGDRCFLWFSENAGGRGLVGSGLVRTVTPRSKVFDLEVQLDHNVSTEFGIANIKAHRDDSTSPIGLIARSIYKHSHNKIAPLSEEGARVLQSNLIARD